MTQGGFNAVNAGYDNYSIQQQQTNYSSTNPIQTNANPSGSVFEAAQSVEQNPIQSGNYTIQSGDTLWDIVQKQFGLTNDADISNMVAQVAQANGIENPDMIYAGDTLNLGGSAGNTSGAMAAANPNADKFNEWASDTENYQNLLSGGQGSEFTMFDDTNIGNYKNNLENFSQSYINKFDTDKDGKLSAEEYALMRTNGTQVDDTTKAKIINEFNGYNLDNDAEHISVGEMASQFFIADLDVEKAKQGGAASALDGKFTTADYYKTLLSPGQEGFEAIHSNKEKFYNTYFGNA